jgi:hypothetical protein
MSIRSADIPGRFVVTLNTQADRNVRAPKKPEMRQVIALTGGSGLRPRHKRAIVMA